MGTRDLHALADRLIGVLTPKATDVGSTIDQVVERERFKCRKSFYNFVRAAWPVVEPHRPFVDGWHIGAICEHLQAITEGQLRNLIINIPPRHMKSTLCGVLWPAWEWIDHPANSFLTSAYADKLSIRDAVKARRVIQSLWYRARWGESFMLTTDQNAKMRYDNDKGGYRIPTSVEGLGTGEGGDRIVVDDPHNVLEVSSSAAMESVITWWDETMSSRGNDPKTVAFLLIMQRVAHNDLAGHVLEQGGYEHLCLPARFRKYFPPTSRGQYDKRTKPGELLWPERFGDEELKTLERKLGTKGANAQLQQEPIPEGGGTFKLEWFERFTVAPAQGMKTVSIDCANKPKELNSYSVLGAFIESVARAHLVDVLREHWEYPDLKRNAINFITRHRPNKVLIEDKGNGTALIQDLRRETRFPIIAIEPEGDKIMRAQRTAPTCEAKRVMLPEYAPWLPEFESEVAHFPQVDFNDQVDMLTQFLDDFARGPMPGFAGAGSRTMQGVNR